MDALALMRRYAHRPSVRYYAAAETVPLDGIVPADWRAAVVDEREDGSGRVERIPYELCVLVALREAIRRREIWVVGADRWRNPDVRPARRFRRQPRRALRALGQPLDPSEFISSLQGELSAALSASTPPWPRTHGRGEHRRTGRASRGSPCRRWPSSPSRRTWSGSRPRSQRRWGTVDLLDVLKEADSPPASSTEFTSVATRETMPDAIAAAPAAAGAVRAGHQHGHQARRGTGEHGETEAALRHVRRLFVNRDNLRAAIATLVNATFAVRDADLWGAGTACASDSKKFGSWSSNLMTEWHDRYGGPGVMIYWHVERKSAVHLQPAQDLLLLRGRGDDRGRAAALHRRARSSATTSTPTAPPSSGSPSPTCSASAAAPAEEHRRRRLYRPDAGPARHCRTWHRC